MGANKDTETVSFEHVSRRAGVAFRYLLLAATLFGIVMLGVLLVYVTLDAIQPFTADRGWHATVLAAAVAPTAAVSWHLYRNDVDALKFGWMVLGMLVVTLMFSGGAAMIFVDILPPIQWFSYTASIAVVGALTVAVERYDRRVGFLPRLLAITAVIYLVFLGIPGPIGAVLGTGQLVPSLPTIVQSIPVLPIDWILMTATLGVGVSAIVATYANRFGDRAGRIAGVASLVGIAASAVVGPFVGIDPMPATVVASVAIVPTTTYLCGVSVGQPEKRSGVLVPGVVLGGALVARTVVETLEFAGPQSWVDWQFLTAPHSSTAVEAGLYPAIGGSILLMLAVAVLSFPLGVGAAVYLEEYAPDNRFSRFIDVNISNLAGVPSVVYGLLGLGIFVNYLGRSTGTVLVGGATLALLILPIVIISSREAIRSVPDELREASYGMGATRWQTVRRVVLPRAFPGILTGTILALGRAIGETAPLIMIGAPNVLFSLPTELSSKVSAMPLQVYAWSSLYAGEDFYTKAVPAGVVVLVSTLLAMNAVAIVLRNKYQSEQ
jgi:phosphate transport system permease protein